MSYYRNYFNQKIVEEWIIQIKEIYIAKLSGAYHSTMVNKLVSQTDLLLLWIWSLKTITAWRQSKFRDRTSRLNPDEPYDRVVYIMAWSGTPSQQQLYFVPETLLNPVLRLSFLIINFWLVFFILILPLFCQNFQISTSIIVKLTKYYYYYYYVRVEKFRIKNRTVSVRIRL